jgi:hypothetical protein
MVAGLVVVSDAKDGSTFLSRVKQSKKNCLSLKIRKF